MLARGHDRDAGMVAWDHNHHAPRVRFIGFEDGSEDVVRADVGHPRKHAADRVTALDTRAFKAELLDLEERLHRVRKARAAEHRAGSGGCGEPLLHRRVGAVLRIPGERLLAPDAEGGRQALAPDDGHRLDAGREVRASAVEPGDVRRERPGRTERPQDVTRIEVIDVDRAYDRRQVLAHDAGDARQHGFRTVERRKGRGRGRLHFACD